jgi:dipeptidyl aminopeptidase/acylaminoacyl peptidase
VAEIFISYSRRDKPFVVALQAALVERGREVWVDLTDIPPSTEWLREIYAGIETAHAFVFVIGPESVASRYCSEEVAHAARHGKRLVPILRRDPGQATIPPELASRQWIPAREEDDFEAALGLLLEAVDTDREWVREHTRLGGRADAWEHGGRDASLLLRGRELEAAEAWLGRAAADTEPRPTPLQTQYLVASRQAATREQQAAIRRQRVTLGASLAALVLMSGLALVAFFQWDRAVTQTAEANAQRERAEAQTAEADAQRANAEARREEAERQQKLATSRALAASAVAQLPTDPELGVLLATRAVGEARTRQAEDALRQALLKSHIRAALHGHTGPVYSAAFSPDGRRVVTAGDDGTARIWAAAGGAPVAELRGHTGRVDSAAFGPDGRLVVTASADGTGRVWEAAGGAPVAELRGHEGVVGSAAFSPDGRLVITAGDDGTARIWEAAGGAPLAELRGHGKPVGSARFGPSAGRVVVNSAAFSPDGRRVVTAGDDGTARVYACDLCGPIDGLILLAPTRVTRDLTARELEAYLQESRRP